jgi:hypothetical protein
MLGVMKGTTDCFGAVVEPDQSGPAAGSTLPTRPVVDTACTSRATRHVSAVLVEGSRRRYGGLNMLRRTSDANLAVDLRTL